MVRGNLALLSALMVASCTSPARVPPDVVKGVEAAVLKEYRGPKGPQHIEVLGMWFMNNEPTFGVICGEIASPPVLHPKKPTLRFISDPGHKFTQIEFHDLWIGNGIGMTIVETNRKLFDEMWESNCAEHSPLRPWWKFWL